ncbi:PA domain [Dillenia turbinata]|uniref:PA domain n=1 Tax=Dillenia turbinata TaxID=194707 RepID=A0AAN8ZE56_9MAGN
MGLFWFLVFLSISSSVVCVENDIQTYIVRVQNDLKPSAYSDVEHWYSSTLKSLDSYPLTNTNSESEQVKKGDFLHVYRTVFHGFSTRLTAQQAQQLKQRREILGVFPDRVRQLHTTRSPEFLGLISPASLSNGLLKESDFGSNVILGILDTGIWPERHSFHDEGLGPIPSHWKGECVEGENFTKALCNNKVIGARYFTAGYDAGRGGIFPINTSDVKSARDTDGHGDALPAKSFFPIVYAGNLTGAGFSSAMCMPNSMKPELIRGKLVVCDRGGIPRVAKGLAVRDAGGAGVVIANVAPLGEGLVADAHLIPGLAITESNGSTLKAFIATSQNPRATIVFHETRVGVKPAPVVASFSSRGPNPESAFVLKPDIIAPGVNILAAWPDGVSPTELKADPRRTLFNIASGTSMACPHVSGLAGLLKGAHPDWSAAMIRSALMTTADAHDHEGKPLLDETTYNVSNLWAFGAGHVNPERAVDPGLVYDLTVRDYVNFLCASNYTPRDIRTITHTPVKCSGVPLKPWNLNYPAISAEFDHSGPSNSEVEVMRIVTYVGNGPSTYTVEVVNPHGAIVTVDPAKLVFNKYNEKQNYVVRIVAEKRSVLPGNVERESGWLTWTDGTRHVTSPIVVNWK